MELKKSKLKFESKLGDDFLSLKDMDSDIKLKFESKLGDDFLSLKDMDSNIIVKQLEDSIKMREMSVEKRMKKGLNQKV